MSTSNHTPEIPYGYCHCGCGQKTSLSTRTNSRLNQVNGEPMRFIHGHSTRMPIHERFWSKVAIVAEFDKCWEWQSNRNNSGYGMIIVNKRNWLAHRFAWELTNGKIPDGLCVLHRCDNPACVNPAHLFLGTNRDNVHDKMQKGRQAKGEKLRRVKQGEQNPSHKLTNEQVKYIRERYSAGDISQSELAKEMGIRQGNVWAIVNNLTWKQLPNADIDKD